MYVDRKVTNIKTIENLFNQLTNPKSSRFAIEKINKVKYELPNYIETNQAFVKHKDNQQAANIEVINNLVFLNNINQVVYKQIMKQFMNNSDNKIKLLCSFNIKYVMFDGNDDFEARYFTSDFTTALIK